MSDPYQRWCPDCQRMVDPTIGGETMATYHGDDTSTVKCPYCGLQLGHLVWWPDQGEATR